MDFALYLLPLFLFATSLSLIVATIHIYHCVYTRIVLLYCHSKWIAFILSQSMPLSLCVCFHYSVAANTLIECQYSYLAYACLVGSGFTGLSKQDPVPKRMIVESVHVSLSNKVYQNKTRNS